MLDHQTQALLTAVSQNSQLKKLNLGRNNLSTVNPVVLATAVMKLESVDLRETNLDTQQLTSILTYVLEDTNLKKLWMGRNRTVDVAIGVVRNAREKLGDRLDIYT